MMLHLVIVNEISIIYTPINSSVEIGRTPSKLRQLNDIVIAGWHRLCESLMLITTYFIIMEPRLLP